MTLEELKQFVIESGTEEKPLVDVERLKSVEHNETELTVIVDFDGLERSERHTYEDTLTDALEALDEFDEVFVEGEMSEADVPAASAAPAAPEPGLHMHQPTAQVTPPRSALSGVKNIIGVASGKGGVGKSTVATNLAMALRAKGASVGICDIDIYGPSIPIQLGVADAKPGVAADQKRFEPVEAYGLKIMSIGFLMDDDTPVIWRGPIVSSVVKQFLEDVNWGDLDYLVIDMPPGTGDAQLTLTQSAPLTGVVIVTTSSELALVDAQKGLQMFRKVDVPVLGLIENMAYYVCGECGHKAHPFNGGKAEAIASKFGTEILAQIPLDHHIQRGGDEGHPVVDVLPDSPQAEAFLGLADDLMTKCPVAPSDDGKKGFLANLFNR